MLMMYKYLGLILDDWWSFRMHVKPQIETASKRVYVVNVNIMLQNFAIFFQLEHFQVYKD